MYGLKKDTSTVVLDNSLKFIERRTIESSAETVNYVRAYTALCGSHANHLLDESLSSFQDGLAYLVMFASKDSQAKAEGILDKYGLKDILKRRL